MENIERMLNQIIKNQNEMKHDIRVMKQDIETMKQDIKKLGIQQDENTKILKVLEHNS